MVVRKKLERPRAQVRRLSVSNFKSFAGADLELGPLTLLIGPNASGKSNLIEAVKLLSWMAEGQRIDYVFRRAEDEEVVVRGTAEDLCLDGTAQFAIGCGFALRPGSGVSSHEKEHSFEVRLGVSDSEMRIVGEQLTAPDEPVALYEVKEATDEYGRDMSVAYNNFKPGGRKPQIVCTDEHLILTQLHTPARFGKSHRKAQDVIPSVTRGLADALAGILFIDPEPRRMREYWNRSERKLRGDGANLSSVLYDLCEKQGRKQEVLDFVRRLPEGEIGDIEFIETDRADVMLRLEEDFRGSTRRTDAPLLSDGTLRVLAVAAAVLSAPEGSLVVVEEIDNGVHPSRAEMLVENLQRVSKDRDLRVLLSSHNPALLDALPADAMPDVACCFRDPEDGTSRVKRLDEAQRYPALVGRGSLGHSMSRGEIEDFLKEEVSPGDRSQRKLQWLKEFEDQT